MISRSSERRRWDPENRYTVWKVKEENVMNYTKIAVFGKLAILEKISKKGNFQPSRYNGWYEIVFYSSYGLLSLIRNDNLENLRLQFSKLQNLLPLHSTNGFTAKEKFCQNIVTILQKNPTWTECHIAAWLPLPAYFTTAKLTTEDINVVSQPDTCTCLSLAIAKCCVKTVAGIIRLHPDISIVDKNGNTALHHAAKSTPEVIAEVLKIPKIDSLFGVMNHKKLTAIDVACLGKRHWILRQFMIHGVPASVLCVPYHTNVPANPNPLGKFIKWTSREFDGFDHDRIASGGCPLHWVSEPVGVQREIQHGFSLNFLNNQNETPILLMIKTLKELKINSKLQQNLLRNIYKLAFNNADLNIPDNEGNTPLHYAVGCKDKHVVQICILFGANFNAKNKYQESALHIAANESPFEENYKLLLSIKPEVCAGKENPKCSQRCLAPVSSDVPHVTTKVFNKLSPHRARANEILNRENFSEPETGTSRGCMMTIDGGGVKGLVSIQMMLELESYLTKPIHEYFDWFCGTSTGALIASALVIGRKLTDIRKLYFQVKDDVFCGKKPYDCKKLDKIFKQELKGEMRLCDLGEMYKRHLIITATDISGHPPVLEIFRSFQIGPQKNLPQETIELWAALRASSAAPTFFKVFRNYIDGGLLSNNPTLDALNDFVNYQIRMKDHNDPRPIPELEVCVSFGQSKHPFEKQDLVVVYNNLTTFSLLTSGLKRMHIIFNQVKSLILGSNGHIVDRAESYCHLMNTLFYRICPEIPKEFRLTLDETDDHLILQTLWESKIYAVQHAEELQEVAKVLEALSNHKSVETSKTPIPSQTFPINCSSLEKTSKESLNSKTNMSMKTQK